MVIWQGGSKKKLDRFLERYHRSVKGFASDKQLLSLHFAFSFNWQLFVNTECTQQCHCVCKYS